MWDKAKTTPIEDVRAEIDRLKRTAPQMRTDAQLGMQMNEHVAKVLDAMTDQQNRAWLALQADGVHPDRMQFVRETGRPEVGVLVDGKPAATTFVRLSMDANIPGTFGRVETVFHAPYEHLAR